MRSRIGVLFSSFEKSSQFKHAVVSMAIAETAGGKKNYADVGGFRLLDEQPRQLGGGDS